MKDAWNALLDVGLPAGPTRPRPVPPAAWERVRDALATVLRQASELESWQREALAAWLAALEDHWPTRHAWLLETGTPRDSLRREGDDPSRFLKLRRIAIDHLSRIA